MAGTGRARERPSRISQGLALGLSIAIVLMAGWLAVTIMLSRYATTAASGDTEMTNPPARVENSPVSDEPRVAIGENSADIKPMAQDYASATPTSPRSALPLAPFAEPPAAAASLPASALLPTATAVPEGDYPSIPAAPSYPPPRARQVAVVARTPAEAAEAIADLLRPPPLPLPQPYPARRVAEGSVGVASIPVPRPRPRLEDEEVQPSPQRSAFDFLIDRQR